jgi:protein-S-isoprenylcysteine O-methyltransferase Ste14
MYRLSLVVVFLGYLGWGFWCGNDPVKMRISSSLSVPLGIGLAVIGFGLFAYAEMKKGSVGEEQELITTGIYAKLRHPMYLGIILFHIGLPLVFRSFVALVSTVLWAAVIFAWKGYEERNLVRQFGEKYIEYKKQTWF